MPPVTSLQRRLALYVIPDRAFGGGRSLLEQAEAALAGGAGTLQVRDKGAPGRELFELTVAFRRLCDPHGALLIVNDRLDVALAAGADGVHLGHEDLPVREARRLVPPGFLIGASVSNDAELQSAEEGGADYLGVGAVFSTPTKKNAEWVGIDGLRHFCGRTCLPTVAIGGIKLENVREALNAGAGGVAVVSAVVGEPDIAAAAAAFRAVLDRRAAP